MDGAITELGYARSAELIAQAERAAKRLAEQLALNACCEFGAVFDRRGDRDARWRGLPAHQHDWPEWLWERFCEDVDADVSDAELFAMRAPFCAEAAMRLDDAGFDCR